MFTPNHYAGIISTAAAHPAVQHLVKPFFPVDVPITTQTDDEGRTLFCVPEEVENALQRQRKLAMYIGGPMVIAAGVQSKGSLLFRMAVIGLGVACIAAHKAQYQMVEKAR
tara:strand:+ start:1257 stop:1589 length:333 start_codon:yes stop_codon:yes gene_type:complete